MGIALLKENVEWNRESPSYSQDYIVTADGSTPAADVAWSALRSFVGGWYLGSFSLPARNAATGLWAMSGSFSHEFENTRGGIILTINYGVPDVETQEQEEKENGSSSLQLGDLSVSTGVDAISLEEGSYEFTEGTRSGEKLEGITPSKKVVQSSVSISKHMTTLPDLTDYVGKVNSEELTIPSYPAIEAGRVLMASPSISKTFTTDASDRYKITFNFDVLHDHTHNQFWDGEAWSAVDPPPFEEIDLSEAFVEGD
ncbi:hypothetical protein [Rubinisphaera italica]|uniref:Uncharacterized protein n=1 Tax=Rubinisphaera italica TaxID=2527969 RepID=A0A5C5XQ90_9PLAN|nr:hypothetical protein [Rubinisphaera italica]TWT64235.1 hypothetical protein Pan54_49960 [Rubinisphaera italica]